MIKKSKELTECVDSVYNYLKGKEYDSRFSWEDLKQATGNMAVTKNRLYYILSRVNEMLMTTDSRCLQNVNGFGKRIIRPQEHVLVARKTVKRSVNIYKNAGRILGSTDLDRLDDDEKKEVVDDANKFRTLQLFTSELLKKKSLKDTRDIPKEDAGFLLDVIKLLKN